MRTRLFGLVLALLLPSVAMAVGVEKHAQSGNILLLASTACNASASARQFTFNSAAVGGFGLVAVQIDFTRVAATAVALSCQTSKNRNLVATPTWASQTVCNGITAGVCALVPASWSRDVSGGSENIEIRTDILGSQDARCTFSCTGGGGSDLAVIYGKLSTL